MIQLLICNEHNYAMFFIIDLKKPNKFFLLTKDMNIKKAG